MSALGLIEPVGVGRVRIAHTAIIQRHFIKLLGLGFCSHELPLSSAGALSAQEQAADVRVLQQFVA